MAGLHILIIILYQIGTEASCHSHTPGGGKVNGVRTDLVRVLWYGEEALTAVVCVSTLAVWHWGWGDKT